LIKFKENKKILLIKFLFKNIKRKYLFDDGYFEGFRTNYTNKNYWHHQNEIAKLRHKNNNHKKTANTKIRAIFVIVTTLFVALFNDLYVPLFVENSDSIFLKITSVGVSGVVMSAPIIFIIWVFRDQNKLLELENARKDTNLKEFQQLQRWATGNIEGDKDNKDNNNNKIALQISALHSLRAYLKGEYGESFRRGAYEIFRANLATQHQEILEQANKEGSKGIVSEINKCNLTKQLNIIASEEWFNLLINHNFPTNNISLLGVDLHQKYLHHRTYGKQLDLESAQLQGADLRCAQLQGVNLKDAQLQGADLRRAQLQGVNLKDAQLQGADLRCAQLQGVYLGKSLGFIKFEQRIKQQLDKKTNEEGLKKQYTVLSKDQKVKLVATLKAVDNVRARRAIKRIESAPETLDLSEVTTGKYSQQEADEWDKRL